MGSGICRAITFINYHIPIAADLEQEIPYITIGFFDGMFTERLEVRYEEEGLKPLWRYGIRRTKESKGQYSYQNIFCFSQDEWNGCRDDEFWSVSSNEAYPLTFVVFLQVREAREEQDYIFLQCKAFGEAVMNKLEEGGICYTYCTIDKNDFVVCLKCRNYKTAVDAIKSLHGTEAEIVYSYSVFSISGTVLKHLHEERFVDVFIQELDSICLKGITNSYDPMHKLTLDRKYFEFCSKLADKIYAPGKKGDYKIYDILGEDDFRFIARKVSLGSLMQQFAPGGILCCWERKFRFYLFSSSLLLNTDTNMTKQKAVDEQEIVSALESMEQEFQTPYCNELEAKMSNIRMTLLENQSGSFDNERAVTFCHAIWQLLQSLKALEIAPTRKYDFWSLFQPLSLMVEILEQKMEETGRNYNSEKQNTGKGHFMEISFVDGRDEIYNFVHKISMAMHGTLRTDIQFFQIRDFNAILHYAPAKLRAFYSLWALRFSDFYNKFCPEENKNHYSFIFTAGMFKKISVQQLFEDYKDDKRLLLITAPERNMYALQWFPIILAHEVSHFVGYTVRNRETRHETWIKGCARVLQLEMNYYRYVVSGKEWEAEVKYIIPKLPLLGQLQQWLLEVEKEFRAEWPHAFHSRNSFETIKLAFRRVSEKYLEKMVSDDCEQMNILLQKENNNKAAVNSYDKKEKLEQIQKIEKIRRLCIGFFEPLLAFEQKFQSRALKPVLKLFNYIDTEAYADLNAVLSLGLMPEEYLLCFVRGELESYAQKGEPEGMAKVRIALTIHAVQETVKNHSVESLLGKDFCVRWVEDVFPALALKFSTSSVEGKLALDIYDYATGFRDCNKCFEDYKSLYNYQEDVQDFSNKELGFFKDQLIWEYMTEYLTKCAADYISILKEKEELQKMRSALAETYEKIGRGSISSMVQEIDSFLVGYEKDMSKSKN